jgi:hypothetical protein
MQTQTKHPPGKRIIATILSFFLALSLIPTNFFTLQASAYGAVVPTMPGVVTIDRYLTATDEGLKPKYNSPNGLGMANIFDVIMSNHEADVTLGYEAVGMCLDHSYGLQRNGGNNSWGIADGGSS